MYISIMGLFLGIYFFDYARKPTGVEAQSCITIRPQIRYNTQSGAQGNPKPNGGCQTTTFSENINGAPGVDNTFVALTGWKLNYINGDENADQISVRILDPIDSSSPNQVTFRIKACLNDNNNDNPFRWSTSYVIVRWL